MSFLIKSSNLYNGFDIFFSLNNYNLFLKGIIGVSSMKLPSYFFFKIAKNSISFIFLKRFQYISILKQIIYLYKEIFFLGFIRLRIKGLGYRIKEICPGFFRFFFGSTNFFYFYSPVNILVRAKKRHMIFLSNKFSYLKSLLSQLLLLKKLSVYRVRGLVYPRQMMFLKIGKKSF